MVSCIRHIFQSADLQREDGQLNNYLYLSYLISTCQTYPRPLATST